VAGCGGESSALREDVTDAAPQEYAGEVFLALGALVDPTNADGHHLLASAPEALSDVRFCLGTAGECGATPTAKVVGTNAVTANGNTVHVSQEYVAMRHALTVTLLAKDAAGATRTKVIRVGAVGQDLPPLEGECHKAPDEFVCSVEREIVRLTNEKRAGSGRGALAFDKKLGYVARLWSTEQARMGSISHAWFSNGRLAQEYQKEFGESARLSAENVAMNGGGSTPEAVAKAFINQWWNSSGHKANMLGGHARLGVGVARRGSSWYGTQDFGR
jgi:uncharacterized protein YkwD